MPIADVSERSLTELQSLAGRAVVVTGGARGMGAAMGRRFAEAGCSVLLADRNADQVGETANKIAAESGRTVLGVAADVTDAAAVQSVVDRAVGEFGRLDVWVNNAGVYPNRALLDTDEQTWDRVNDLNVRAAFFAAQAAARAMIAAGNGGVIVNFSSTQGFKAQGDGFAAYVTSKHAVVGLTKSLAGELGRHGIRVLGIAPGLVLTEGVAEMQEQMMKTATPELIRAFEAGEMARPLGRPCVPDDIARVAVFLASDMSMIMTGSVVFADAGDSIR